MKIRTRLWALDHWTAWQPASGAMIHSLDDSDRAELWRGEILNRHGGVQQVAAVDRLQNFERRKSETLKS